MRRNRPALGVSLFASTALTAVAVALLGGCGNSSGSGDPSPGAATVAASPTSSDPSATSPSATPTSPVRAVTNDLAAAAAVTQLHIYYAEYNLMLRSGESDRFRQTFARSCRECLLDAMRIDRVQSRGQRIEGGVGTLTRLRVTAVHREVVVVEGVLAEMPFRVMSANRVLSRFPAMPPTKMSWTASKATGTWLVVQAEPLR